jgi:hypothetical protein
MEFTLATGQKDPEIATMIGKALEELSRKTKEEPEFILPKTEDREEP